ncbi:hypothetical protein Goklo_013045 [Gossypium klotzschianum]|uniref:RING-type E3 ubiquitin transferase n=1 Tax=Gossypium klotzschianum TaxID=34286 RepID=A0A7J8U315_9ROSI|nr:hypothetical protein [Gossypium klotzschianum]
MVAATESWIQEMIERVIIEGGDEQDCMIPLEEVEVGSEASRMPVSLMALASILYPSNVISHHVHHHGLIQQKRPLPPRHIQIKLIVDINLLRHDLIIDNYTNCFSVQQTLRFSLNILQNRNNLHELLASAFTRLRIDMPSAFYNTLVQEIMGCGVGIANRTFESAWYCKVMYLHSTIQALLVESEINQETLMSRALAESRSEFERINNGMVAATESSIKEMIEKVKVEAGDEEKCMICLEEVEVGFEASQMPCSHVFHDDCIKKWLQQSHYCPICGFEMPID